MKGYRISLLFLLLTPGIATAQAARIAADEKGRSRTPDEESLSCYDAEGNLFFEPGESDIMTGADSRSVQTKRMAVD